MNGTATASPKPHSLPAIAASIALPVDEVSRRHIVMALLALLTFATFFIVEHSLTMSLTSENGEDAEFVEVDLDANVESGSALRKIGFLAFGAAGLLTFAFRSQPLNWGAIAPWTATAFLIWLALSWGWATDRGLCLRRVIVALMMAGGLVGWCRMTSPRQAVHWLGAIVLAFVGLGFLCEIALFQFRPWESGYRFGGTTHPNTLGVLTAFATFYAACRAQLRQEPHRLLWAAVGVLMFVGLVLTKSRTTLAATVIALTVLWMLRTTWPKRLLTVLAGMTAAAGVLFVALLFNVDAVSSVIDALLLGRGEQVTTLTGRTPLWAELNQDIAARPFQGYGFGSFWTPDVIFRVKQNQGWQIPHAHSAYYETTLNLGLIGLVIAVLGVSSVWFRATQLDHRDNVATGMTVAITTFTAIYSLTDTAFALPTFASFSLALIVLQASRFGTAAETPIGGAV